MGSPRAWVKGKCPPDSSSRGLSVGTEQWAGEHVGPAEGRGIPAFGKGRTPGVSERLGRRPLLDRGERGRKGGKALHRSGAAQRTGSNCSECTGPTERSCSCTGSFRYFLGFAAVMVGMFFVP